MMASFTGLRVTMRRKPMLSSIAAAVMLAVALSAAPARAQPLAPEAHDGGILDAISRKLFILNQYVGAGLSSAGHWLSGSAVTPRETQDLPPSPISRGIGVTTANFSSRVRQADGSLVTSDVLKSSPAASRKVFGSLHKVAIQDGGATIFGRGRGKGKGAAPGMPAAGAALGAD